jgi:hypothetical protein
MEQSHSWEANLFAASQEIPRILWNPKVHYQIHKCPPGTCLYPEAAQSSPYPLPHHNSWRSAVILSSHLRLGLSSGFFPSGFPTKTLYTPLPSPHMRYMPRPSHSSRFYHPQNSGWGVQIMKLLIMKFSPLPFTSSLLGPKNSQHPVLKHPQLSSITFNIRLIKTYRCVS